MRSRWRGALVYVLFLVAFAAGLDLALGAFAKSRTQRSFRIAHPFYHHGLRPLASAETTWGGRRYAMHTDSLGCRAAEPARVALRPAGARVLLIGDSMLEGVGVAYEQSAAGVLAERGRARGVEVRNAAVVSYSPKLHALRTRWLVEREGLVVHRLVVFVDVSDAQDEVHYEAFDPRDDLAARAWAWWSPRSLGWQLVERFAFPRPEIDHRFRTDADLDVWMRTIPAYRRPQGNPDAGRFEWTYDDAAFRAFGERGLALAAQHMRALARFCRERGIELAIVVYPSPYQIFAGERDGRQAAFWRRVAADEAVAFVDLFPAFADLAAGDPDAAYARYFIPDDVHWNEAGHAFVAERVEEAVLGSLGR